MSWEGEVIVTIVVMDAAGNPISGLLGKRFSFSLSGGKSTGKFGSVTATAVAGTYTVTFTGTTQSVPSAPSTTFYRQHHPH